MKPLIQSSDQPSPQGLFDKNIKSEQEKYPQIDIHKTKDAAKEMLKSLMQSDSAKDVLKRLFKLLFGEEFREEEVVKPEGSETPQLTEAEKEALAKVLIEVLKASTGLDPDMIQSIELMLLVLSNMAEIGLEPGGIRDKLAEAFDFTLGALDKAVHLFDEFSPSSEDKEQETTEVEADGSKKIKLTITNIDNQKISNWRSFLIDHSKKIEKEPTKDHDFFSAVQKLISMNDESLAAFIKTAQVLSFANKAHEAHQKEKTDDKAQDTKESKDDPVQVSTFWRDKFKPKSAEGKFSDRYKPGQSSDEKSSDGRE